MSDCTWVRERLDALVEGGLEAEETIRVETHVASCPECEQDLEALRLVMTAGAALAEIEPPPSLADELATGPCRRWLGMLFAAVDRELDSAGVERLLVHLEECPSCRRAWNDMSLMHQAGDALTPPEGLLARSIRARTLRRVRIVGRRTASAAAYILAVLASLLLGNPMSGAQTFERLAERVGTEVADVAEDGAGELRVMVYRAWQWTTRHVDSASELIDDLIHPDDDGEVPDSEERRDDRRNP